MNKEFRVTIPIITYKVITVTCDTEKLNKANNVKGMLTTLATNTMLNNELHTIDFTRNVVIEEIVTKQEFIKL